MSRLVQFIPSAIGIPKTHIDPGLFSALIEILCPLRQEESLLGKYHMRSNTLKLSFLHILLASIFLTFVIPSLAASSTKLGPLSCGETLAKDKLDVLGAPLLSQGRSANQIMGIMGNSIFDLFPFLPRSAFAGLGSNIDLDQRYQLTISNYWSISDGKDSGSFAVALNDKQSGINAVWLRVDEQRLVREMKVVGDPANAIIAVSSLSNVPGFGLLRDELNIQPWSQEALSRVDAITREEQTARVRRETVTPLFELRLQHKVDSDNAILVAMGEYAFLRFDSNHKQKALKTYGAGPCVIVVLYQRKAKAGIMMHVSALTDFEQSMQHIASRMNQYDLDFSQPWDLAIIGGDDSSREKIFEIREILGRYRFNLIGQNVLTGETESAWLDLETGRLYEFAVNPKLQSNQNWVVPEMFRRSLKPSVGSQ